VIQVFVAEHRPIEGSPPFEDRGDHHRGGLGGGVRSHRS
jgi:hypothetical protein